jgi:hypothetical protein
MKCPQDKDSESATSQKPDIFARLADKHFPNRKASQAMPFVSQSAPLPPRNSAIRASASGVDGRVGNDGGNDAGNTGATGADGLDAGGAAKKEATVQNSATQAAATDPATQPAARHPAKAGISSMQNPGPSSDAKTEDVVIKTTGMRKHRLGVVRSASSLEISSTAAGNVAFNESELAESPSNSKALYSPALSQGGTISTAATTPISIEASKMKMSNKAEIVDSGKGGSVDSGKGGIVDSGSVAAAESIEGKLETFNNRDDRKLT